MGRRVFCQPLPVDFDLFLVPAPFRAVHDGIDLLFLIGQVDPEQDIRRHAEDAAKLRDLADVRRVPVAFPTGNGGSREAEEFGKLLLRHIVLTAELPDGRSDSHIVFSFVV